MTWVLAVAIFIGTNEIVFAFILCMHFHRKTFLLRGMDSK